MHEGQKNYAWRNPEQMLVQSEKNVWHQTLAKSVFFVVNLHGVYVRAGRDTKYFSKSCVIYRTGLFQPVLKKKQALMIRASLL